jgi:hypothetical protein
MKGFFSDALFYRWYLSNIDVNVWSEVDNIDRRSNLSVEDFIKEYGEPNKPVIITDVVPK